MNIAGMKNWTHELPVKRDKDIFIEILNLVKEASTPSKILEIGSYTGVSLIEMVKITQGTGVAVDNWSISQIECQHGGELKSIFLENIKKSNMEDKIFLEEGDSKDILLKFIKRGEQFDFIYVDGSHKSIDTYLDLVLSWECLKKEGILGIDDYFWIPHSLHPLDYPKPGIDRFLEKFNDQYVILNQGYRIFLKKVI